jgi:formylglycine-generating enzyme required for sulfatase activity
MTRIENTVFISYRRTDVYTALAVYQDLSNKGYDVFFDYTSIPSGDFEQIIVSSIKARAHFVLILTPTALDRCREPGDWLRREIETAMDEKRNIIPLFFKGFSFGTPSISEKLTGKLSDLNRYNGLNVHEDYFLAAMDRLSGQFLSVSLDTVLHPLSTAVRKVVKEQQLAANDVVAQRAKEKPKPVLVATPPNKITLSSGMEFMRVPAGKFLMGSAKENKQAYADERPQHTVDIPYDYFMARFPVTNELYDAYARSSGIKHPVYGWEKKKDHPVTYVKWTDAMEYCEWLNSLFQNELPSGLVLRLPTEAEWEKAARGTDGNEYPWGDDFDKNKCNTNKSGTTPVRLYSPQGDSPYGCADMVGNVWELTHSLTETYPYKTDDGREDEKASGHRVLRGGSFDFSESGARCAYRSDYGVEALFRSQVGFRVVASRVASLLKS